MKSFAGIVGLAVFMLICIWSAGDKLEQVQAKVAQVTECSEKYAELDLCK